ncbi:MAG: RHS repeat domain-containing protein [Chloroflexota bacterium]
MKKNGVTIAQFTYDGDGKRVKSVVDGETTLFVGNYFEQKGSQVTKYYFAGSTRIAMRKYVIPQNMTVEYLLADHLGSTSLTTDADGVKVSEMRYKPWGEVRYTWTASLSTTPAYELTKYTFTGQFSYMDDPSTAGVTEGFGLMFYNARWYDPVNGRFAQADTIVPASTQGTQAWDRYAFVNNNPIRYTDPTGHLTDKEKCPDGVCEDITRQEYRSRPDKIDISLLKGKNAILLYELYQKMWAQKGSWWWKEYGAGGFTIWEFMAVLWSYEQAGYPKESVMATAMSNHAAAWCAYMGCVHNTAEGALSFLAAYSQSARSRTEVVLSGKRTLDEVFYKPPSYYSNGIHVVNAIYNRPGVDFVPLQRGDLYDVGNISLSNEVLSKMIKRDMVYAYWGDGNSMVILTKCQSDFYYAALSHGGVRFINGRNYRLYCGG